MRSVPPAVTFVCRCRIADTRGSSPAGLEGREMKTRRWRIPVSPVEYVVAHELVHLRHPDHTREFWQALGRVMPDCDERRGRLREVGVSLRGQVVMQAAQGDRTG